MQDAAMGSEFQVCCNNTLQHTAARCNTLQHNATGVKIGVGTSFDQDVAMGLEF